MIFLALGEISLKLTLCSLAAECKVEHSLFYACSIHCCMLVLFAVVVFYYKHPMGCDAELA